MTGSVSVARSARTRSLLLAAALLTALGLLSLFVARADAATFFAPTDQPLGGGSQFKGGDGNQANPGVKVGPAAGDPVDSGPAGAKDWQALVGNINLKESPDPNPDSIFTQGSKEDTPDDWTLSTDADGSEPKKTNFFAAWSFVESNTFLYLAFRREDNQGNAFLAFELNQDTRQWRNQAAIDSPGEWTVNCRTTGDIVISYFIQNASNIGVTIQRWTTTSAVTAAEAAAGRTNGEGCAKEGFFTDFDPPANAVQAAINGAGNPFSPGAVTNFLNPATYGTSFPAGTFGEAALNLSLIFENINQNPCFSFGQITMHGRSSESNSAQLDDLVSPVPLILRNCTIGGTKYHDIDADGVIDPGEPTIAGWKLYIDANNNNQLDAGEPTTLTDANGDYVFTNVAAGTHTIREAPDSEQAAGLKGYFCSFPSFVSADCEHSVTLTT